MRRQNGSDMENTDRSERKKSVLGAIAASKLSEMLKNIDISSIKEANGGYNARARITALFDMGTFAETGTYIARSGADDAENNGENCDPSGVFSSVITGYGAVGGRLVYAFAQDNARMRGAFDSVAAGKIAALIRLAIRNGAPLVGIFDSNGASVYEGARVLAAYGDVMRQFEETRGILPTIALIPGVCGGGMATLAASFDFKLAVKGQGEFYVVPPFVGGDGTNINKGAEAVCDIVLDDEDELYPRTRELLSYLPSNCHSGSRVSEAPVLERALPPDMLYSIEHSADSATVDVRRLICALADDDRAVFVGGNAAEAVVGFAYIGGVVCCLAANDHAVHGGVMSRAACRKLSKITSFCNNFGIPLITLVNSDGPDKDECDQAAYAEDIAALYRAMVTSQNAKICIALGHAYGIGFTLMASRSVGGDIAMALPTSFISPMSPEASVAFVWNDRICANDVTVTREELEAKWRAEHASPVDAAVCGQIDDIVSPQELRARIVSAVMMLAAKSRTCPVPAALEVRRQR